MPQRGCSLDLVLPKLEFMVSVLQWTGVSHPLESTQVLELVESIGIIQVISNEINNPIRSGSAKKIDLPIENIEVLLSLQFKVVDIAKIYRVSRYTVSRRLKECGMSVST